MDVADLIDFSTEIDNPPNNGGERVQDHVQQREVVVVQQDLYGDDQEIAGNRQNEKAITEEDETLEEHEGFADTLGTLHGEPIKWKKMLSGRDPEQILEMLFKIIEEDQIPRTIKLFSPNILTALATTIPDTVKSFVQQDGQIVKLPQLIRLRQICKRMVDSNEEEKIILKEEGNVRDEILLFINAKDQDRRLPQNVVSEIQTMYCKLSTCTSRRETLILQEQDDRKNLLRVGFKIYNEYYEVHKNVQQEDLLDSEQQRKLDHETEVIRFWVELTRSMHIKGLSRIDEYEHKLKVRDEPHFRSKVEKAMKTGGYVGKTQPRDETLYERRYSKEFQEKADLVMEQQRVDHSRLRHVLIESEKIVKICLFQYAAIVKQSQIDGCIKFHEITTILDQMMYFNYPEP